MRNKRDITALYHDIIGIYHCEQLCISMSGIITNQEVLFSLDRFMHSSFLTPPDMLQHNLMNVKKYVEMNILIRDEIRMKE